jgi:hypothetical protein
MAENRDHDVRVNKLDLQGQVEHVFSHTWKLRVKKSEKRILRDVEC